MVHAADPVPTTYNTLTIQTTSAAPGQAPVDGANIHERMTFLHRQLDSLGNRRLLDRFVLVGPLERRQGGALSSFHLLRGLSSLLRKLVTNALCLDRQPAHRSHV